MISINNRLNHFLHFDYKSSSFIILYHGHRLLLFLISSPTFHFHFSGKSRLFNYADRILRKIAHILNGFISAYEILSYFIHNNYVVVVVEAFWFSGWTVAQPVNLLTGLDLKN